MAMRRRPDSGDATLVRHRLFAFGALVESVWMLACAERAASIGSASSHVDDVDKELER